MPAGLSIQDEAMDVAQCTPQGAHYLIDVIFLLPYLGVKKELNTNTLRLYALVRRRFYCETARGYLYLSLSHFTMIG